MSTAHNRPPTCAQLHKQELRPRAAALPPFILVVLLLLSDGSGYAAGSRIDSLAADDSDSFEAAAVDILPPPSDDTQYHNVSNFSELQQWLEAALDPGKVQKTITITDDIIWDEAVTLQVRATCSRVTQLLLTSFGITLVVPYAQMSARTTTRRVLGPSMDYVCLLWLCFDGCASVPAGFGNCHAVWR